jgi:hypothetical protein
VPALLGLFAQSGAALLPKLQSHAAGAVTPDELSAGIEGPPGYEGPAGLSLSPEVYEECLAMLRQARIEDDERRANVWWRRLGRKLRSMTKSVMPRWVKSPALPIQGGKHDHP